MLEDHQEPHQPHIDGDRNTTGSINISGPVSGNIVIGGDFEQSLPSAGVAAGSAESVNETPTTLPADAPAVPSFSNKKLGLFIIGLGLVGLCLVGTLGGSVWGVSFLTGQTGPTEIAVRISAAADGAAIPRARALLFVEGERQVGSTDTTGTVSFTLSDVDETTRLNLIAEADGYEIEELQGVSLPADGFLTIRLSQQTGAANVILLVTDEMDEAVAGAEAILLLEGQTYRQLTDADGLARFTNLPLTAATDAQLRITAADYQTDAQTLTLQPDSALGIRLDRTSESFQEIEGLMDER